MASNLEFVQFVCDQLGEQVSCRRMFGEYGLFAHGKYFACVCGNQLFFKATPGGRTLLGSALGSCQLEPPYPGAALKLRGSVAHSGRKRLRPGGCSPKGAFKRIR